MEASLESPASSAEESTVLLSKNNGVPQHVDGSTNAEPLIFPRRACVLRSFKVISLFAILVSAVLLGAQMAAIAVFHVWFVPTILRLYISVFCIVLVLTELRIESLVRNVSTYDNWVYRGFLYSFIGLIGVVMAMTNEIEELPESLQTRQMIVHLITLGASYSMFAIGVVYMLMGICCLHGVWERMKAGYDAEMDHAGLEESSRV